MVDNCDIKPWMYKKKYCNLSREIERKSETEREWWSGGVWWWGGGGREGERACVKERTMQVYDM